MVKRYQASWIIVTILQVIAQRIYFVPVDFSSVYIFTKIIMPARSYEYLFFSFFFVFFFGGGGSYKLFLLI